MVYIIRGCDFMQKKLTQATGGRRWRVFAEVRISAFLMLTFSLSSVSK